MEPPSQTPSPEQVAKELSEPLLRFLGRYGGNPAIADDLRQETLIRITNGLPGFAGGGEPKDVGLLYSEHGLLPIISGSPITEFTSLMLMKHPGRPEVIVTVGDEGGASVDERRDRNQTQVREALNHPVVADAIEIFSGKLVDVKIRQEVDK